MKVYRIKHVKSGLYFRPAAGYPKKSHLNKLGKVYLRKPNIDDYVGTSFYHDFKDGSGYTPPWGSKLNRQHDRSEGDFVIEEFEIVPMRGKILCNEEFFYDNCEEGIHEAYTDVLAKLGNDFKGTVTVTISYKEE